MKLYHYTTFSNFCSIWVQQKLKFSEWTNCNDVYERDRAYKLTQESKGFNGKNFPAGVLRQFTHDVFTEVERYKQVSFCLDYTDVKGFASPMMWGHYARDYQRSGVCIELESQNIKPIQKDTEDKPIIYHNKVDYNNILLPTHIAGIDIEKKDAVQEFVVTNRRQLFFQKHPHWKHENEYRYISKNCDYLDVSDAITMVYILGEDDVTLQSVKLIVKDTKKISFVNISGLDSLNMTSMNLYDKEELQELMNNINSKKSWNTE